MLRPAVGGQFIGIDKAVAVLVELGEAGFGRVDVLGLRNGAVTFGIHAFYFTRSGALFALDHARRRRNLLGSDLAATVGVDLVEVGGSRGDVFGLSHDAVVVGIDLVEILLRELRALLLDAGLLDICTLALRDLALCMHMRR